MKQTDSVLRDRRSLPECQDPLALTRLLMNTFHNGPFQAVSWELPSPRIPNALFALAPGFRRGDEWVFIPYVTDQSVLKPAMTGLV